MEIIFCIIQLYDFSLQSGCLALPAALHSEVALLVVEAYQKYLTDKPYAGIISEGLKQVLMQFSRSHGAWLLIATIHFYLFLERPHVINISAYFPLLFFLRCPIQPTSCVWATLQRRLLTSGHGTWRCDLSFTPVKGILWVPGVHCLPLMCLMFRRSQTHPPCTRCLKL